MTLSLKNKAMGVYIKCTVKNVRFVFVNVFEPDSFGGRDTYNVTCIINKKSPEIDTLRKAFEQAATEGKSILGRTKVDFDNFLKDGNAVAEDWGDVFEDVLYFKAACDPQYGQPAVVKPNPARFTDKNASKVIAISDPQEFYAGCHGMVSIEFHPYSNVNTGITAILKAVCKTADGERLSSGSQSAEEAFGAAVDELPENTDDDVF